ncbi:maleylpyruvate isomerase family mycothiol-dependent enzyme [Streptomyces sp. HU2014]|uniref:maleylpyruvate isomerase family mycothiol-dependent enzyme n=1 Tax=Streptomyces sp. HU2014 TaxID=2939414 RepID=UPI00200CF74F|nr:maleylpyruvate isomerase family mycothiol-dependent enzyme [Streptomyces sp. HU2014]UQI45250.1 maleylpyruvate isomerase family mycothiol-dependent enzyme [Streptomyces sp. HU2014]
MNPSSRESPDRYERHRWEILAQTDLLRSHLSGADPASPVPSCPGWDLGRLLRHLGATHRWAATVVRTRATRPVPDTEVNHPPERPGEGPAELGAWLAEGAGQLADALRAAGPGAAVWTPGPGGTSGFWARRMAYETAVHRADAALAVGVEFTLGAEAALDALDEWMEFGVLPEAVDPGPGTPGLLGPGRVLRFHATDAPAHAPGEWLVDLTGTSATWRRARPAGITADAAASVRGPLADLLLFVYRRPVPAGRVEVTGDVPLLDLWRERTGFWLEEE